MWGQLVVQTVPVSINCSCFVSIAEHLTVTVIEVADWFCVYDANEC